mgnify:CR=1 FL=1
MAEITLPGEIERQSMKIIAGELEDRGICLSEEYRPVVHRVIHATADFDFADSLTFTDHAVSLSVKALQEGTAIVTDTNMAKAGISSVALRRLHTEVHCLMADPLIAERAKQAGTTRAVAAMHASSERYPGAVYAIGNAPTALMELCQLIRKGKARPSGIIAAPVGFVHVRESKHMVKPFCNIPKLIVEGRKGGSNLAATLCNAILCYDDAEQLRPGRDL